MKFFRNKMIMLAAGAVLAVGMFGCSSLLKEGQSVIAEYKSVFSVIIQAVAYDTNTPVTSGSWKLVGTDKSGSVSSDGSFMISGLAEGAYKVQVWSDGYAVSEKSFTIDANAMNSGAQAQLQETRNEFFYKVNVYPSTAVAVIKIYKGNNGGLASKAKAMISFVGLGSGSETVYLNTNMTGGFTTQSTMPAITSEVTGNAVITNAPAWTTLYVDNLPYDSNGDGKYEYRSTNVEQLLMPYGTNMATVNVTLIMPTDHMLNTPYSKNEIVIVQTNIDTTNSRLTGPTAWFEFSEAMCTQNYSDTDMLLTSVQLWDQTGSDTIPVTLNWTTATRLEVSPIADELIATHTYDININSVYAADMRKESWTTEFDGLNWIVTRVSPVDDISSYISGFSLQNSTVTFDYKDRDVNLQWNVLTAANSYDLYVRDSNMNSEWLFLDTVNSVGDNDDVTGTITTSVYIPAIFDYYSQDNEVTPFLNGVTVSMTIVPTNWETPMMGNNSSLPIITIGDNKAPEVVTGDVTITTQGTPTANSFVNTPNASAATGRWAINFGEPMDISVAPTITMGSLVTGIDWATDLIWHWGTPADNTDTTQGYFELAIPANTDVTKGGLQEFKLSFTGMKDTSGNAINSNVPYQALTTLP